MLYFYLLATLINYSIKSPTRCNNFLVYYPDVYLQLNMFRVFSCPSSGAQRLHKRQDNKLENCCMWLVIYLNCTVMHGLTNLKGNERLCFIFHQHNFFRHTKMSCQQGNS